MRNSKGSHFYAFNKRSHMRIYSAYINIIILILYNLWKGLQNYKYYSKLAHMYSDWLYFRSLASEYDYREKKTTYFVCVYVCYMKYVLLYMYLLCMFLFVFICVMYLCAICIYVCVYGRVNLCIHKFHLYLCMYFIKWHVYVCMISIYVLVMLPSSMSTNIWL